MAGKLGGLDAGRLKNINRTQIRADAHRLKGSIKIAKRIESNEARKPEGSDYCKVKFWSGHLLTLFLQFTVFPAKTGSPFYPSLGIE
jgi:hypothetical protein